MIRLHGHTNYPTLTHPYLQTLPWTMFPDVYPPKYTLIVNSYLNPHIQGWTDLNSHSYFYQWMQYFRKCTQKTGMMCLHHYFNTTNPSHIRRQNQCLNYNPAPEDTTLTSLWIAANNGQHYPINNLIY